MGVGSKKNDWRAKRRHEASFNNATKEGESSVKIGTKREREIYVI